MSALRNTPSRPHMDEFPAHRNLGCCPAGYTDNYRLLRPNQARHDF